MSAQRSPFYPRLAALATMLATLVVVLGLRLTWLARASAEPSERDRRFEIPAPRGTIWDRQGMPLATDSYAYEIGLDLATARQQDDLVALCEAIAIPLGQPAAEILERAQVAIDAYTQALTTTRWIRLAPLVDIPTSKALAAYEDQGVTQRRIPHRIYPLGADSAHVTGFLYAGPEPGDRPVAALGVEASYDATLTGIDGQLAGYSGSQPGDFRPARAGTDLRLTIDRDIQVAAARALAETIEQQSATGGTVIVLEVASGAILASTSLPSFDPNHFETADPASFSDPAVSASYEPGSVLKSVTLAAAIDAGAVTPDSHYQDEGTIEYEGLHIQNSDHLGHGWISMRDMMVNSLNVGAVWTAGQLGREPFYRALSDFGFGVPTGVDLAAEASGIVHWPAVEGEDWYAGNLATNSFGQGLSATPLQVAAAIAAIANDGRLMQPYVLAEALPAGRPGVPTQPRMVRQVIGAESAREVRQLMQAVVDDKATQAALPGYAVAGKTGTSQIPVPGGYDDTGTIASFAGFLPVDQPQVLILTKVDRPHAVRGSDVAAPLFREVAKAVVAALDIPPDRAQALGGGER
ncbi:MAG: penicillin-binding protein 2 [Caldilineae bacterium]|nr:penicillin-binding protein 2 [Chloroflexota bacterium]MCB9177713.1 penicillin-binding protein 2 [Caldilineae bacterium]